MIQRLSDSLWRVRCFVCLYFRLGSTWSVRQLWSISGTILGAEQENRERHGDPLPSPIDSVDEELSCWSD